MGVTLAITMLILGVAAVLTQMQANRPIGEGELFDVETESAASAILSDEIEGRSTMEAIRRTRNDLRVEAVSIVDGTGDVVASTSPTLIRRPLDNPVVAFGLSQGRFAAAAMPISTPIELDGVTEWSVGDTVYVVGRPLDESRSAVFHYDVSELLARRSRAVGIAPTTVGLLVVAALAGVVAATLEIGRTRAASRMAVLERESQLLRSHTHELEARNAELRLARTALSLIHI